MADLLDLVDFLDSRSVSAERKRDKLAREMTHKPFVPANVHPLDIMALSTTAAPILGDVMGALADTRRFIQEPETRTPGNFAMSGIGLLPFVPGAFGTMKKMSGSDRIGLVATGNPKVPRSVEILPGGRAEVRQAYDFGWPSFPEVRDQIFEAFDKKFRQAVDFGKGFWRFTNNKKEVQLAKSGKLRPSRNYVDKTTERGVSVSDHPAYGSTQGYRYGYRVDGDVIGYGSDGEPLLDPKSIKVIERARTPSEIDKEYFTKLREAKNKVFKELQMTEDQYDELIGDIKLK